jgi:hypothetical protein
MRRFTLLLLVALLGATEGVAAQETVETRGVTSVVKIDEVLFGHLTELNGKFKLRATELTFTPDGYIGDVYPRRLHRSASPRWARNSICDFRRAHIRRGRPGDGL